MLVVLVVRNNTYCGNASMCGDSFGVLEWSYWWLAGYILRSYEK
ncbi:hypothetical protein I3842_15G141100 [Carya illinoinensis]|uniref:Uncharacterized protein n=1 Tax=Carya illinoinensis TaxID=32201 RepID=A0A922ACH4_CARIL|nr:hypothetical protein I3842_15G141100 [Carya illinoinensis]